MREDLLDILERLVRVKEELGDHTFHRACHRARLAIGAAVLEIAEERRPGGARRYDPTLSAKAKPNINHDELK